ncbi:MAG: MMPL family transporter [Proteobacteria bacterium]|nr:MMPL family transporter [Pseudomonadota bacterium]
MIRAWLERGIDHRWQILGVALIIAIGAAALLAQLRFDANYSALLPDDSPMVREFEAVREKLGGGTSDLILELRGPEAQRKAFARQLAGDLERDPRIAFADFELPGTSFVSTFFTERGLLLIPFSDLKELERAVKSAYRESIGRAVAIVDLEEESDPWQPVRDVQIRLADRAQKLRPRSGHGDDSARYVFVRPKVSMTELAGIRQFMSAVQAAVARLGAVHSDVEVRYAGRLAIHLAEQRATSEDLARATAIALVLVVLITAAMARRTTGPVIIAVPLVLSIEITLAASTLLVDRLNLISGFMMPALVGLGIDFGIHLYFRFLVEIAKNGQPTAAMRESIRATIGASATSALTTAGAFFALAAVDFRGFRELGLLGGLGVLVTFLTTYAVLPPLALTLTRVRTGIERSHRKTGHVMASSGVDFAPQCRPGPADGNTSVGSHGGHRRLWRRRIALLIVISAVLAGLWSLWQLPRLSFENDFDRLKGKADAIARTERIEAKFGLILAPAVIMVSDLETARRVEAIALAMARQAGEPTSGLSGAPTAIRDAVAITRLLPEDVSERLSLMTQMRDVLERVLAFGKLNQEDQQAIENLVELTRAQPWSVDDVPRPVRRRLMARDGSRFFVFVWPNNRLYRDTAMREWLGVLDSLTARARSAIQASGRAVNGSRSDQLAAAIRVLDERRLPLHVVDMVRRDLPAALALASLLVVLILIGHFRRVVSVVVVAGAIALAIVATLAVLAATAIQLNIYNAVIIPCIVGIGMDNAIHIQHAYHRGGVGSLPRVLSTTGIAVFLASLTTAVGFGATITARQGGLEAMGLTAVIGAMCAFVSSTVVLPAVLYLLERSRNGGPTT